jgi:hypothetical protein
VHRGVGKSPERVRIVGQKVGGDQGIFTGPDDLTAERAVGAATSIRSMTVRWHSTIVLAPTTPPLCQASLAIVRSAR